MKIIGAGLAGLLAGNILRKMQPVIYEKTNSLPNNHTALLRHRENKISEATAIPFKKVKVSKAICDNVDSRPMLFTTPNIIQMNNYSHKVTGGYYNRSISNLDPVDRYIAPPNFIEQLSYGLNIKYGQDFKLPKSKSKNPIISTIPMPEMARMAGVDLKLDFEFNEITVINCDIHGVDVDLYQTVYFSSPNTKIYRASITGNRFIIEHIGDGGIKKDDHWFEKEYPKMILDYAFGISSDKIVISNFSMKKNKYGKIKDVNSQERKDFIKYLTDKYNIYSLGRYATWRNILLDDVHNDVFVIKKLIESNGYITR